MGLADRRPPEAALLSWEVAGDLVFAERAGEGGGLHKEMMADGARGQRRAGSYVYFDTLMECPRGFTKKGKGKGKGLGLGPARRPGGGGGGGVQEGLGRGGGMRARPSQGVAERDVEI